MKAWDSKLISKKFQGHFPIHVDREAVYTTTGTDIFRIPHGGAEPERIASLDTGPLKKIIANSNLLKRLTRYHVSNFFIRGDGGKTLVLGNEVFIIPEGKKTGKKSWSFAKMRRFIFNSVCCLNNEVILAGEYCDNPGRGAVKIWVSKDGGLSWDAAYEFKKGAIRHVHAILRDPYTDKLWILTGDRGDEAAIIITDSSFASIRYAGRGEQVYRAVSLIFEKDCVVWGTDSEIEKNFIMRYDRSSGRVERIRDIIGPAFSGAKTKEGVSFIATGSESRNGIFRAQKAAVYASNNTRRWKKIIEFEKDIYSNRYFQFGFAIFPAGEMAKDSICLGGLGLKGIDNSTVYMDYNRVMESVGA